MLGNSASQDLQVKAVIGASIVKRHVVYALPQSTVLPTDVGPDECYARRRKCAGPGAAF